MTLIRKLALALCLAFLFITPSSNSQTIDPTTGNLINFSGVVTSTTSNWNNAGSVGQQLTCWQGGDPGYCGPLPRVSAWGQGSNIINYSYGLTDLNQVINVKNAIANANGSTTGINVTGFKFSFTAKNGNGWDNGQQDQLNAYVKFYDTTNTKVLENYNYDLNRRYNWTTFSYNETFTTPRAVTTLGNAQVGFIGRDTNFWVGPYGPEIMNTSFSLKYAVDPCANSYVYNPQCPNSSLPVAAAPPPIAAAPPPIAAAGSLDIGGIQLGSAGGINVAGMAPPPAAEPPPAMSATPPGAIAGPGQAPPPGAAPNPAQGPGPTANAGPAPRQEGGGKSSNGPSSLAMSVVSRVQAADRATQASAVANAQQVAATSSSKAQEQANQVVEQANAISAESSQASQSMTSSTMQQNNSQQQTASSSSAVALQGPSVMSVQTLTAVANSSQATANTGVAQRVENNNVDTSIYSLASNNSQRYNPGISANSQANSAPVVTAPVLLIQQKQEFKFETRTEQEQPQTFLLPQTVMTRGNVINDILEQRLNIGSMQMEQQMDTVKKNVLPNELAGGVDIATIAMIPKGYEAYSIVTLRDVPFYKSEPIYKDNKTVDNARVFRGLTGGSDALHQRMVDMQYKQGE
jgi:hypothetical protein